MMSFKAPEWAGGLLTAVGVIQRLQVLAQIYSSSIGVLPQKKAC